MKSNSSSLSQCSHTSANMQHKATTSLSESSQTPGKVFLQKHRLPFPHPPSASGLAPEREILLVLRLLSRNDCGLIKPILCMTVTKNVLLDSPVLNLHAYWSPYRHILSILVGHSYTPHRGSAHGRGGDAPRDSEWGSGTLWWGGWGTRRTRGRGGGGATFSMPFISVLSFQNTTLTPLGDRCPFSALHSPPLVSDIICPVAAGYITQIWVSD